MSHRPETEPCQTQWVGCEPIYFCDDCDHVLAAHTSDHRCSICAAVASVEIGTLTTSVLKEMLRRRRQAIEEC
jgi:uncharacterized protein YlaI